MAIQFKARDQFTALMGQALLWADKNRRSLIAVVSILVLAFCTLLVLKSRNEGGIVDANQEAYRAAQSPDKVAAYEEFLKQNKEGALASYVALDLFSQLAKAGKNDEAKKVLDQALTSAPDFLKPLIIGSQAQFLADQGDVDQALKVLEAAPNGEYPQLVRAWILESAGRKDEAKAIYESLVKALDTPEFIKSRASQGLAGLEL